MSMKQSDIQMQGVIALGLTFLRENPQTIDEIFEYFREPHLSTLYGQKEIDKIKEWFLTEKIPVLMPWAIASPAQIPCYVVHIKTVAEDTSSGAYLGDYGGQTVKAIKAKIIVNSFRAISYDKSNGVIIVPDSVSLDNVNLNHILIDANNTQFVIESPIEKDKFGVPPNSVIDTTILQIISPIDKSVHELGSVHTWEQLMIAILGHGDQNIIMWMTSILQWIVLRFKNILENRDLEISGFSIGEMVREDAYMGENVFSRHMSFRARVQSNWTLSDLVSAEDFDITIITDQVDGGDGVTVFESLNDSWGVIQD